MCPTLLEFQSEQYEHLSKELKTQQENLKSYVEGYQETKQGDKNFFRSIYQLEIDRLQYLLKNYLRVRLAKVSPIKTQIQKHALSIIKQPEQLRLLNRAEDEFLKGYAKLRYE